MSENDKQIAALKQQIEALKGDLDSAATARRRSGIAAELHRQNPDAREAVKRLAMAELSHSDGDASELVKEFLASELVAPLVAPPAPTPPRQYTPAELAKGKERPKLSAMLESIANGGAFLKF